jgi:hypothetical protein
MFELFIKGISVPALVLACVEAVKGFGVKTKLGKRISAFIFGFLFTGLAIGIHENMISPEAVPYIEWGVYSLAGALSAMGVYDFGKNRVFI